jgi:hypothetical protein
MIFVSMEKGFCGRFRLEVIGAAPASRTVPRQHSTVGADTANSGIFLRPAICWLHALMFLIQKTDHHLAKAMGFPSTHPYGDAENAQTPEIC